MATPKLPPPPRSPQSSSGFASSLARHHVAPGSHQLGADQVVAGEPVLGGQVADATAERQAGDPGGADHAAWRCEAVRLRRRVEVEPGGAASRDGDARLRIDSDAPHPGQIDHDAVVDGAVTGRVMTAAANGDLQAMGPGEGKRARDVAGIHAARDRRRPPVDQQVEAAVALARTRGLTAPARRPSGPCEAGSLARPSQVETGSHRKTHRCAAARESIPGADDRLPGQARRPARVPHRRVRGARARARPGAAAGRHLRADREQRHLRGDGRGDVLLGLLPRRGRLGPGADVGLRRGRAKRGRGRRARHAPVRLPAPVLAPRRDARRRRRARLRRRLAAPSGAALGLPPLPGEREPTPSTGRTPRRCRCSCARSSSPRS